MSFGAAATTEMEATRRGIWRRREGSCIFGLPATSKTKLSKLNSQHSLGYNGFAEETTLGKKDLR